MAKTSNGGDDIDFKWGKRTGVGGQNREVQFYESFLFDGVEYSRYDCVYLFKKNEPEPYVGKLLRIWQNADKSRKVKVLWFFRPDEIVNHLGTTKVLENELFLASGEGVGLANINPLEAIAGKCHVICISEDIRNPQPSVEERQMADFVFFRTFDVKQCKIMDKIDEKIAGTEVKFLFNRVGSLNRNVVEKVVSLDTEDEDLGKNELPSEALPSGSGTLEGKKDGKEEEPSLNAKTNGHACGEHLLVSPRDKTTSPVVQFDDLNRPLKKRKMDASEILLSNKYKNDDGKPIDEFGVRCQASIQSGSASENHLKSKYLSGSPRGERDLILKQEQKSMELSRGKSREVSSHQSPQKDYKNNHKASQAALPVDVSMKKLIDQFPSSKHRSAFMAFKELEFHLRVPPNSSRTVNQLELMGKIMERDKNTWFNELPFEERIQTAWEQETLVLLRNLDPTYASTEVEDIIWQGFKEKCSAKMLSQIASSSPHCGQAFVIFKTKEAAKRAIKKLNSGCLVLPDGRPLVGCIETPCSPGKPSKFNGHLVISNPKQPQTREMKEAVSTSHCSQPNTIVYDMAMEWCLLQQRSDFVLAKLYTQQALELRKLKAHLKSK